MSKGRNWKLSQSLEQKCWTCTKHSGCWVPERSRDNMKEGKYSSQNTWPHANWESVTNLWLENSSLFHKLETLKFYTLKASGILSMNSLTGFRTGDLPGPCSNCHTKLWRLRLHILPTLSPQGLQQQGFLSSPNLSLGVPADVLFEI